MDFPALDWDVVARIAVAILGGGVLGWEREIRGKPAGLRTHMMVSLGAALLILVALRFMHSLKDDPVREFVQFDLAKVMEGIVGGIGFLGAGAIIQSRDSVRGLTTAASIWLAAATGMTCGMGYFDLAGGAVLLAIVVLMLFGAFEQFLTEKRVPHHSDTSTPSESGPRK